MKSNFAGALTAGALLAAAASPALAQGAPAPVGVWQTADHSEMLVVMSNATCRFTAGRQLIIGRCSWQPSSRGGILTILNQTNYKPAPIRYSVVWINATTITVFGDVFHKTGN